jgi:glycosyltransferase involved in cell wall biosynthesis
VEERLKVLLLISSAGFFGAENVVLQLARELAREASIMPLVGSLENPLSPHLELLERCEESGIRTVRFQCKGRMDTGTIPKVRQFLREQKISIIHSHGYKSDFVAYFAAKRLSIIRISTCHTWNKDSFRHYLYARLDKMILKSFDMTIGVSKEICNQLLGAGIRPERTRFIANGISFDQPEKKPDLQTTRAELGIKPESVVVGMIGRFVPQKGHKYLLEISKEIVEKKPGTIFLLVGDGPLLDEMKRTYNYPWIVYAGIRKDMPAIYQCIDILALPSLYEGLPMVVLEAMACRRAVIASCVGEIPDVITDRATGLLLKPGDPEALKHALFSLLQNQEERDRLAGNGYEWAKSRFDSARMAREYLEIYRDLCGIRLNNESGSFPGGVLSGV